MTPGGHLDQIWQRNREAGVATPIAAAIGVHPLLCYAALAAGELATDDYDIAGSVFGSRLSVVQGLSDSQLMIPSHAEIVLEGHIEAAQQVQEGPFGEFLGFEAAKGDRPVVTFDSMTSRKDPIFQDIVAGQTEHMTMSSVGLRARLRRDYLDKVPAVTDYWLPAAMTLFIAVDTEAGNGPDIRQLMHRLLSNERYMKQVICFDAGTDLRKLAATQSAIACFVQGDRDIDVITDCDGNGVDPSEIDGKTTKLAIDARAKGDIVRTELPADIESQFDLSAWL